MLIRLALIVPGLLAAGVIRAMYNGTMHGSIAVPLLGTCIAVVFVALGAVVVTRRRRKSMQLDCAEFGSRWISSYNDCALRAWTGDFAEHDLQWADGLLCRAEGDDWHIFFRVSRECLYLHGDRSMVQQCHILLSARRPFSRLLATAYLVLWRRNVSLELHGATRPVDSLVLLLVLHAGGFHSYDGLHGLWGRLT